MLTWIEAALAHPIWGTALRLLLLLVLCLVLRRLLQAAIDRVDRRMQATVLEIDRRNRLHTLLRAGYGVAVAILLLVAATMALQLLGLSIGPVLASAGVAGLAISLGAQSLIRDYLGGVLILVEDQFRVGDVIEVSGVSGEVVRMTLRVTYLRDVGGRLHTVPNGDIRVITNATRDWARAVVDLNLELGTDTSRALRALEQAMARLQSDPALSDDLIGPPEILTWNNLTDWAVQVRLMAKTRPGKQWTVARFLRQYAVEALQAEGVPVALPMSVWQERGNGS